MEIGDKIVLKYDDADANQEIVGKVVVVEEIITTTSPCWVNVVYEGRRYGVRGNDCVPVEIWTRMRNRKKG